MITISLPSNVRNLSDMLDYLRDIGVKVVFDTHNGQPLVDEPEKPSETISMWDGNTVPDREVVLRETGEYLITERIFSSLGPDGELVYAVLHKLTSQEFFDSLGLSDRSVGPCLAADLSDWLVNAFDSGIAFDYIDAPAALFVWRGPDGRMIHQHST